MLLTPLKYCDLTMFPKVASLDSITVGESEGVFKDSAPNCIDASRFSEAVLRLPKLDARSIRTIAQIVPTKQPCAERLRDFEVKVEDQGYYKGLWDSAGTFVRVENGPKGVVDYFLRFRESQPNDWCTKLLRYASCLMEISKPDNSSEVAKYSPVRNWMKSWIRAISWHPNYSILGVALNDDSVRIFTAQLDIIPMLRCAEQKNVSCLAWRPCVTSELAIGVQNGIIVWNLTGSTSNKPSTRRLQFVSVEGHYPVTRIEYSHSGYFLVSASPKDACLFIWDTISWEKIALYDKRGYGVPFALWNFRDDSIFCASKDNAFHVWNRNVTWTPTRWDIQKLKVQAACWLPGSDKIIFASEAKLFIINGRLTELDKFVNHSENKAIPLANLNSYMFEVDSEKSIRIGGVVRHMECDPTGSRLALLFEDSDVVAVFRVQSKSLNILAPLGFIHGFREETPVAISFQKDFTDGAQLTIAWNSGRIHYVPMILPHSGNRLDSVHKEEFFKKKNNSSLYQGHEFPSVIPTTQLPEPEQMDVTRNTTSARLFSVRSSQH